MKRSDTNLNRPRIIFSVLLLDNIFITLALPLIFASIISLLVGYWKRIKVLLNIPLISLLSMLSIFLYYCWIMDKTKNPLLNDLLYTVLALLLCIAWFLHRISLELGEELSEEVV